MTRARRNGPTLDRPHYPFREREEMYADADFYDDRRILAALADARSARDVMGKNARESERLFGHPGSFLVSENWYADDVHTLLAEAKRRGLRKNPPPTKAHLSAAVPSVAQLRALRPGEKLRVGTVFAWVEHGRWWVNTTQGGVSFHKSPERARAAFVRLVRREAGARSNPRPRALAKPRRATVAAKLQKLAYESGLVAFPGPTHVQTLIFAKSHHTRLGARAWARRHGFHSGDVDEKAGTFRLRQYDPALFVPGTFRTLPFGRGTGIQAVIGVPR